MQPIFIAAGQLRTVDRGLYSDTEKITSFFHLVQAATDSDAERKVRGYYEAKTKESCGGGPYGERYVIQEMDVWEQIGEINLL